MHYNMKNKISQYLISLASDPLDEDILENFILDENIPIDYSRTSLENLEKIQSIKYNTEYQPPIKSDWKVSGTFSLSPTDARHPKGHLGIDMRAPGGTFIYSFAPGIVTHVGTDNKGGYVVKIDHKNGIKTYYAHCGTVMVHDRDEVDNNTPIATVGDSGNAKGTFPHLHFQVSKDGVVQDPAKYFTVPKYTAPNKDEKSWISQDAKQEASNFNMSKHLSSNVSNTENKHSISNSLLNKIIRKYSIKL